MTPDQNLHLQSVQKECTVTAELGLHLRTAGALVQLASQFSCDIFLHRGEMTVDAKSIMNVLSLAAGKGTTLLISGSGQDAPGAVDAVVHFINSGFRH